MTDPKTNFTLTDGRSIHLVRLNQVGTYEGLLEGVPTNEMNRRHIRYVVEKSIADWGMEPYVVPPVSTPIDIGRTYPFGTPASIPSTTCVALFRSYQPARDAREDFSELTVIWFQEEFALPIDPAVAEQLRALDWAGHAVDGSW